MNSENPPARERFYRRERQSVPAAREFTRAALADWGVRGGTYDDILLCVSELATNALLHGVPPGRGFQLRLLPYGEVLRIEVHDSGDGYPRVVAPGDESGRGLLLVSSVADKWGVAERDPGKIVWCEFAVDRPGDRWECIGWNAMRENTSFRDGDPRRNR
ncbi:histidine kinase-, DNA gyrase B-, and HSP90-like ATPase [Streptomyces jeddahensis]|uniref:Histidine kinase-, DNA gyrase B-, and HSP90-like ATPase n=2 Tax=Streptomyces jeddahensis TaxID=1716141 RepID=A0A177HX69_9ACTN|nr:ATP-binding protein [Streptomyces jeddahensis]OAH15197.1 histidine kinase-, DNA gyrase B-, and HSP90-like ATPase [Streptomyces jeddahensis]